MLIHIQILRCCNPASFKEITKWVDDPHDVWWQGRISNFVIHHQFEVNCFPLGYISFSWRGQSSVLDWDSGRTQGFCLWGIEVQITPRVPCRVCILDILFFKDFYVWLHLDIHTSHRVWSSVHRVFTQT